MYVSSPLALPLSENNSTELESIRRQTAVQIEASVERMREWV